MTPKAKQAEQIPVNGDSNDIHLDGWGWGEGTGARAPRRVDWVWLPPGIESMGARYGGDITGASGKRAQRARAIGAGEDPESARAQQYAEWRDCLERVQAIDARRAAMLDPDGPAERAELLAMEQELADLRAARAAIVAQVMAEQEEGKRILALAGGAGWGDGKRVVTLQSGGMAARAARCIKARRGHTPSETSLQEAAAAAARAIWFEWTVLQSLWPVEWNEDSIHHLAACGWRAAFHSYRMDQAQGRKGDRADESGAMVPLTEASLAVERASLTAWARDGQGRIFDQGEVPGAKERRARRGVLRWIGSVLDIRAKGRAGAAERARFSVLARLIHGRDIAGAARAAGFANGKQALESFRTGRVWPRLRAACANHRGNRERALIGARLRAVRVAIQAIRAQCAARAGSGRADIGAAVARAVTVQSGAACVQYVPCGFKVVHPAARRVIVTYGLTGRGLVHPLARAWAQATTARGQAVAVARSARSALISARRERIEQFDSATRGMRAGWNR